MHLVSSARRFGTAWALLIAVPGGLFFALLLPLADKGPLIVFRQRGDAPRGALLAGVIATSLGVRPTLWKLAGLIATSGLPFLLIPMRRLRELPRRRGLALAEVERWIRPNLAYDPS